MPHYWTLTGGAASKFVVVRQRDKQMLSKYSLAAVASIDSRMDSWLANPLERNILRSICEAVSKLSAATDALMKKTLKVAFQSRQLLAAEIPYTGTTLEATGTTLEALHIVLIRNVPPDVHGEELQVLIAQRLSKGRLSHEQATKLIRSGRVSGLAEAKNPGTGDVQVNLWHSQHVLLAGQGVSAPTLPPAPIQLGFITHRHGGNIRTLPAEQPGSRCLTSAPLPPGTRLVVLGASSPLPDWVRVAAAWEGHIVRGYIQGFRVTTDLPEPAATLYHVKPNDTLEPIAARIYHQAIQPGRDLRFYENVILHVNQRAGRRGVRRVDGDVQLVAGECIWLVSVAFANTLQGIVPSGSVTGGALAQARQVARHFEDLLDSMRRAHRFMPGVAGIYWEALQEHLFEIILVIMVFITAEALSISLAASPTGVGQLAAVLLQVGMAYYGLKGIGEAGATALKHACDWINLAWRACGDAGQIDQASVSFCHMVVNIGMAALGALGIKSNINSGLSGALKAAEVLSYKTPSLVMQTAGGGQVVVGFGSKLDIAVMAEVKKAPAGATAGITNRAKARGAPKDPSPLGGKPAKQPLTKRPLTDAELDKLLDQIPNWEGIKDFVGRPIPKPGTPEFITLKAKLKEAGYQLEELSGFNQPYRIKRFPGKAKSDVLAELTVTQEGIVVLKTGKITRLSVYSRYRHNYLAWVEDTYGEAARRAAEIHIASGHQLHHLIPDEIAQSHVLVKEALKRLKDYTIDRGSNMLSMPSGPNASGQIIHLGQHPKYSKFVGSKLDNALKEVTRRGRILLDDVKPAELDKVLRRIEGELRKSIESGDLPDEVLKELLEEGLPVGKKLSMLEIRHQGEWFTA